MIKSLSFEILMTMQEEKMKKIIISILTVCMVLCMAGCGNVQSGKSFTYNVETGDKVQIRLDTTDDYDLSSDLPFEISKDGKTLSTGSFIKAEGYEQYVEAVTASESAEIIEQGTKDSNKYMFWRYNGEYNYVVIVGESDTGVLIGNKESEESARECFNRLKITLKK